MHLFIKYILITEANGGLASAIVDDLLKKGEYIIGLDISISQRNEKKFLGIKCDITNDDEVNLAFEQVKKKKQTISM